MPKAMSSAKKKPAMSVNGAKKAGVNNKPVAKSPEKESQETATKNLVVNAGNKNGKK